VSGAQEDGSSARSKGGGSDTPAAVVRGDEGDGTVPKRGKRQKKRRATKAGDGTGGSGGRREGGSRGRDEKDPAMSGRQQTMSP